MKRILHLLLILALATFAFGQADVVSSTIGPYLTLVRGANWGSAGIGNSNNAYIYTPWTTSAVSCVSIANNNPTNAHTYTINFLTTGDTNNTKYYSTPSKQARWITIGTLTDSVPAGGVKVYSFNTLASASAQVNISATATQAGVPDTLDIYVAQANANINCASSTFNAGNLNITVQNLCPLSAVATAGTAASAVLVAAPATGFIHVCAFTMGGGVWTAQAALNFDTGTAGTCASLGTVDWSITQPNTAEGPMSLGSGNSQLFQTNVASQALCINNTGLGASATVSISYYIG